MCSHKSRQISSKISRNVNTILLWPTCSCVMHPSIASFNERGVLIKIAVAGVVVAGLVVASVAVAGVAVVGVAVAGVAVAGLAVAGVAVSGVAVTGVAVAGVTVAGVAVASALAWLSRCYTRTKTLLYYEFFYLNTNTYIHTYIHTSYIHT